MVFLDQTTILRVCTEPVYLPKVHHLKCSALLNGEGHVQELPTSGLRSTPPCYLSEMSQVNFTAGIFLSCKDPGCQETDPVVCQSTVIIWVRAVFFVANYSALPDGKPIQFPPFSHVSVSYEFTLIFLNLFIFLAYTQHPYIFLR